MNKLFTIICWLILVTQMPVYGGRHKIHGAPFAESDRAPAQNPQANAGYIEDDIMDPMQLPSAPQPGFFCGIFTALFCLRSDNDDGDSDEVEIVRNPGLEIMESTSGDPANGNLLDLFEDCRGVIIEFLFHDFKDVAGLMFAHPLLGQSVLKYFSRDSTPKILVKYPGRTLGYIFAALEPLDEGEVADHLAAHRNLRVEVLVSAKDYLEDLRGEIFFENSETNKRAWSYATNAIFDKLSAAVNEKIGQKLRYVFLKRADTKTVFAGEIDREGLGGLITSIKKAIWAAKKRECLEICEGCCKPCCGDHQRESCLSCKILWRAQTAGSLVCCLPCQLPLFLLAPLKDCYDLCASEV